MTPAETLIAAADRIRDLAAVWEAENAKMAERRNKGLAALHAEYGRAYTWDEVAGFVVDEYADKALDAGAAWIAALSPALASMIERWLRETAANADRSIPAWQNSSVDGYPGPKRTETEVGALVEHHYGAALGVARAVLGSGVATDG